MMPAPTVAAGSAPGQGKAGDWQGSHPEGLGHQDSPSAEEEGIP